MQLVKQLLDNQWGNDVYDEDYYDMLSASESGSRITASPSTCQTEYDAFSSSLSSSISTMEAYDVLAYDVQQQAVAFLNTCAP